MLTCLHHRSTSSPPLTMMANAARVLRTQVSEHPRPSPTASHPHASAISTTPAHDHDHPLTTRPHACSHAPTIPNTLLLHAHRSPSRTHATTTTTLPYHPRSPSHTHTTHSEDEGDDMTGHGQCHNNNAMPTAKTSMTTRGRGRMTMMGDHEGDGHDNNGDSTTTTLPCIKTTTTRRQRGGGGGQQQRGTTRGTDTMRDTTTTTVTPPPPPPCPAST